MMGACAPVVGLPSPAPESAGAVPACQREKADSTAYVRQINLFVELLSRVGRRRPRVDDNRTLPTSAFLAASHFGLRANQNGPSASQIDLGAKQFGLRAVETGLRARKFALRASELDLRAS
jgi:hypothetical protein